MTAWYDDAIGHGYITGFQGYGTDTPHYAYDLETPFHTPLSAPLAGTVVKADYAAWGGEIFIQPDDKRLPEYYFYHPDEVDVQKGQHVNAGQQIALSGGENPGYPGAEHPAQPEWSTGPHTHMGWYTNWTVTPEGTRPYGPEPHALLEDAKNVGIGGGGNSGTSSFNVPSNVYNAVEPIAKKDGVPDAIWETVAFVESGFNANATGDNGTSFGLFQLHQGGQLGNLSAQQAYDPATNAQAAMPSIAAAWNDTKSDFKATDSGWWEVFAIKSGHPGGSLFDPATQTESQELMKAYTTGSTSGVTTGAQDAAGAVNTAANAATASIGTAISGAITSAESNFTGWVGKEVTTLEGDASKAFGTVTTSVTSLMIRAGIGILGIGLISFGAQDIIAALRGETPTEMNEDIVGAVPVVGDTLKGGMQKADRAIRGNRAAGASASKRSTSSKKTTTKKKQPAQPKQEKASTPKPDTSGAASKVGTVEKVAGDVGKVAEVAA